MQAESQLPIALISIVLTALGLAITVVGTLAGFAYRTLNNRITEVKDDNRSAVRDEERRRNDAVASVVTHVNTQYTELRLEIHAMREDIKELRKDA